MRLRVSWFWGLGFRVSCFWGGIGGVLRGVLRYPVAEFISPKTVYTFGFAESLVSQKVQRVVTQLLRIIRI